MFKCSEQNFSENYWKKGFEFHKTKTHSTCKNLFPTCEALFFHFIPSRTSFGSTWYSNRAQRVRGTWLQHRLPLHRAPPQFARAAHTKSIRCSKTTHLREIWRNNGQQNSTKSYKGKINWCYFRPGYTWQDAPTCRELRSWFVPEKKYNFMRNWTGTRGKVGELVINVIRHRTQIR